MKKFANAINRIMATNVIKTFDNIFFIFIIESFFELEVNSTTEVLQKYSF